MLSLSLAVGVGMAAWATPAGAQDLDALIAQLDRRDCRYSDDVHAPCSECSWTYRWFHWFDPTAKYRCTLGAARCLGQVGPAARRAVPALVRALTKGPNDYDSGDGWIAARSGVATALGQIGDPRAIDPLAEVLALGAPPDRGPGALPSKEPAARHALVEALGRFGAAASRHRHLVEAVLRERNADTARLQEGREQYERSAAMDLATDEHRKRAPEDASFSISEAVIDEARRRLDCTSPGYRRELESTVRDVLASAAATTLGAFGRAESAPLLVETLRNPAAAEAAAGALAALGERSDATLIALERALADSVLGPAARGAAARALGRLGDERQAQVLARGLQDPELRLGAAEGLADLGVRASGALASLVTLLEIPIRADRNARGVNYDIEATKRLGEKTAAVRAIASIGGTRARAALAPFARDPDIGSNVRRALARVERVPGR